MNLDNLKDKKIAILGLGIENYALVKFLIANFIANYKRIPPRRDEFSELDITICDARSKEKLGEKYSVIASVAKQSRRAETTGLLRRTRRAPRNDVNIKWKLGKNYDKSLEKFDILFRSPGWPINCPGIQKALKKSPNPLYQGGIIVSSPMKLFFDLCPTKNIVGVTGTKGKGTTSSLIYHIFKKAGKRVWLGGNIGVAPFEFIDKIKKNDWVVLELSSFQLEDMEKSPHIAVIINFSSEHLAPADPNNPNYHKSLKAYWEAKMNIVKWQSKNDFFVLNSKLKTQNSKPQLKTQNFKSKKIYFFKSNLITKLIGEHNKENIAAAAEVAKIIGIKDNVIKKAVAEFKGLEHRLEYIKNIKGVKYYNDSFATTPESAIIALKSFSAPIILIAGGAEKNSNFKKFAREIKRRVHPVKSRLKGGSRSEFNRVKYVILLNGGATQRIKKELLKIKYSKVNIEIAQSIKEAVKIAHSISVGGDIVLLSPACASFGMFANYKERGKMFKKEVNSIILNS